MKSYQDRVDEILDAGIKKNNKRIHSLEQDLEKLDHTIGSLQSAKAVLDEQYNVVYQETMNIVQRRVRIPMYFTVNNQVVKYSGLEYEVLDEEGTYLINIKYTLPNDPKDIYRTVPFESFVYPNNPVELEAIWNKEVTHD